MSADHDSGGWSKLMGGATARGQDNKRSHYQADSNGNDLIKSP